MSTTRFRSSKHGSYNLERACEYAHNVSCAVNPRWSKHCFEEQLRQKGVGDDQIGKVILHRKCKRA